jgi:hypothetical protein
MNFNPKWGRHGQTDSNPTFSNFWRRDGKRQCSSGSVLTDKAGSARISENQWRTARISEWRLQLPAEQLPFWKMGGRKINPIRTREVSSRFRRCATALSAWLHTSKYIPVKAYIISWFRWRGGDSLQNCSCELSDAGISSVRLLARQLSPFEDNWTLYYTKSGVTSDVMDNIVMSNPGWQASSEDAGGCVDFIPKLPKTVSHHLPRISLWVPTQRFNSIPGRKKKGGGDRTQLVNCKI